ncbi:MAG: hypothetical protein OXP11_11030 [Gammaproteobacteria bacterium]|nr:hypothetical protein [Gammaproteobacteria bacterium]
MFLHELLGAGQVKKSAQTVLAKESRRVARRFANQRPWCRVVLQGSEEPLPKRLISALDDAAVSYWAGRLGRKPAVLERIRAARECGNLPESDLLGLIDDLQDALEQSGAGGLLLLFDELGKFLEYEARQGGGGIFLLQQLAERAFKGGPTNLVILVLLHQGFDLYARGLGESLRSDWTKVQGRFQNVPFVEPPEQTLRLLATAFDNNLTEPQDRQVRQRAKGFAKALSAANALPPTLNAGEAADLFARCYPIHPIALLLLPDLCHRFAQNERTLFTYLASREPHGFRDAIASLNKVGEWLHPASIYDYFTSNQPAVLSDPLNHRRWVEVVTAVERADSIDAAHDRALGQPSDSALAKAIGLLNLVSRAGGLRASEPVLRLLTPRGSAFRTIIQRLRKASVIQYRKFSDEYRVWQGTDFDIDERTTIEADKLGFFSLAQALRTRNAIPAVVARRHSIEKGSLRYFNIEFADPDARSLANDGDDSVSQRTPPRIVFVLSERRDHEQAFHAMRADAAEGELWALYRDGATIRAAIADVLSLEAVQRTAQELASDPVAAREVRERINAARVAEHDAVKLLLGDPAQSQWYDGPHRLDIPNRRCLQFELSRIMDRVYKDSPIIRNELINRNRLSPQAAAARNKLFQHMLDMRTQPDLGIDKYPPERAIYRSILQAGGLHIETPQDWTFVPPVDDSDILRLRPTWDRLDDLMASSEETPITIESLSDSLAAPPIGLRRGVFPILFLHYYLLHRYEIALYEDGTYVPKLNYEHLERLVRRPDLHSAQRFRIAGVRAELFDEYCRALFDRRLDTADPLQLARAMVQFVDGLDEYTLKTRRLSPDTLLVREALYLAKSPQKLLFEALPRACGYGSNDDLNGFGEKLQNALRELRNAQSDLFEEMRRAFCMAFDTDETTPLSLLREKLRSRAEGLDRYTIDTEGLRSFVLRVANRSPDDDGDWFAGVLRILGRKPTEKWTDQDRATAEYRLAEFAARHLDLEKLRLHFGASSQHGGAHEAILVKLISTTDGEFEEVVVLNADKDRAIKETLRDIEAKLATIDDDDLQIALIARLSSHLLSAYREARLSTSREQGELRRSQ